MELVLAAFDQVATGPAILAIIIGTALGIVIGGIPGLGSVVGLTICLPLTFVLDPVPAVSLLLGVYCGSVYGGSLSAILVNTPGTPQAAATSLDGYPMAMQGKAGLALGWVTMSSVIGGLVSCVVLIIAAPQIARVAVRFGAIETFALIVLSLFCIAAISRGTMIKGLLAGVLGLSISTVGADPMTGFMRFTFDTFVLNAGLDLIPVAVGLFALSEVFVRITTGLGKHGKLAESVSIKLPPWREWRPRLLVLGKSSMIGSFVGTLPGTGAATAAFLAYAEARRSSPRREGLGKGEPDGLVAAESANNAVTGSAMIPTLALGIPGDVVTAILLGALVIHGITPGANLMAEHTVTVYAIFISLILINLVMLALSFPAARAFRQILRTPEPLLMGGIVVFSMLGAYAVRGNPLDLITAVVAGIVGYIMRMTGFPVAPLVIGMVLGPRLEMSLRQGLVLTYDNFWAFFTHSPVATLLFALSGAFLVGPLVLAWWNRGKVASNAA